MELEFGDTLYIVFEYFEGSNDDSSSFSMFRNKEYYNISSTYPHENNEERAVRISKKIFPYSVKMEIGHSDYDIVSIGTDSESRKEEQIKIFIDELKK